MIFKRLFLQIHLTLLTQYFSFVVDSYYAGMEIIPFHVSI